MSGNERFSQEVVAWAFQETNVLRVESVGHHRANETETPKTYTTNDKVVSLRYLMLSHRF